MPLWAPISCGNSPLPMLLMILTVLRNRECQHFVHHASVGICLILEWWPWDNVLWGRKLQAYKKKKPFSAHQECILKVRFVTVSRAWYEHRPIISASQETEPEGSQAHSSLAWATKRVWSHLSQNKSTKRPQWYSTVPASTMWSPRS